MKRAFDVVVSLTCLFLLSPILLLIALATLIAMGRPILFRQRRPGLQEKPFTIYKFRTMTRGVNSDGTHLPDQDRLTAFGRFLRSSSLDELPELWNVLRGEMSLVGPRPLLMEYIPLYNAVQRRRHDVRPGITGWAQIHGRNLLSWDEKFELDVWYVDHQSLVLDLKILFLTVLKILKREGVSAEGHVTMPNFSGSRTNPLEMDPKETNC